MLRMLGVRRHGIVVSDMAREFGVAARTIRRDLEKLQTLGFPICETTGQAEAKGPAPCSPRGRPSPRIYLRRSHRTAPGSPFPRAPCGTQLWESAHIACSRKIKSTLSKQSMLQYLEEFPRVFHCTTHGYSNYADKAETNDTLTIASEDRKAVLLTYQSQHATEPATRDVYPYGLNAPQRLALSRRVRRRAKNRFGVTRSIGSRRPT